MIGLDLLYPGPLLRAGLERALAPWLQPERLWLSASHTHRAPLTDPYKPGLGLVDPSYIGAIASRLAHAARSLIDGSGTESTISVFVGSSQHGIHRRRKTRWLDGNLTLRRRVRLAPHATGATDDALIIAVLESVDGAPRAVVWNYGCHPVADFERSAVAAHFPAVVREAVRDHFGDPSLPVLFLQGFSGDVRPSNTTRPNTMLDWADRVLRGPRFFDMTASTYAEWTASLASDVLRIASGVPHRGAGASIEVARTVERAGEFVNGSREDASVSFHAIRFDDLLTIVGASAEVVSAYAPQVRAQSSTRYAMCVGCLDDTYGYSPTSEMLEEGGYEAGGYCRDFGLAGVRSDIEDKMIASFRRVIDRTA